MRMKALGVGLMVVFAAFTTVYWIIDAPRREAFTVSREEELLEFGRIVFLPDDTYTVVVVINQTGFGQMVGDAIEPLTSLELFVNSSISFENESGRELMVTGTGARTFEEAVADGRSAAAKFDEEGETTVTATGIDGSLVVTAGPPHLQPYGANCARCHAVDGTGGIGPDLHSLSLANKWVQTGGAQSLNNYVSWVITLGGVVVRGDINSIMPAWGQEFGGSLTRQQIEALTAMIGEWAAETLENPPPSPVEVPDTVEAGAQVYADAGCVACHGVDLEGGVGPNLQTIGSSLVTDGLTTDTLDIDQMQSDYDADPRAFLEAWIRDSSTYNGGNPTAMPPFSDDAMSDSQLQALVTFLLSHTE